jgi:hypothetical protein
MHEIVHKYVKCTSNFTVHWCRCERHLLLRMQPKMKSCSNSSLPKLKLVYTVAHLFRLSFIFLDFHLQQPQSRLSSSCSRSFSESLSESLLFFVAAVQRRLCRGRHQGRRKPSTRPACSCCSTGGPLQRRGASHARLCGSRSAS